MTDTTTRITRLLDTAFPNAAPIDLTANIYDALPDLDRLGLFQLAADVEREFSLELGEDDMATIATVADLVGLVDRLRGLAK